MVSFKYQTKRVTNIEENMLVDSGTYRVEVDGTVSITL